MLFYVDIFMWEGMQYAPVSFSVDGLLYGLQYMLDWLYYNLNWSCWDIIQVRWTWWW